MAAEEALIKAVEQMKDGNREGFDTLYSYTYNYVYSRARYYMNNNEEDALDLTQETYMQVYKGIQNLQDAGNIYAWLGAIVYRQSMKMHNKNKDILLNEEAEGIFEDIECTSKDFKPEETAEENAVVDVIKGMLQELPEQQRQAVLAFYYDRMKIDEIAELFDCSPNTIKSRLNYAKQYLKEKVLAHEKKYAYRLHSVTPAVVYLAFKSLFVEKDYVLAAEKAQNLYNSICTILGIVPTTSVIGGTTVSTVSKAGVAVKIGTTIKLVLEVIVKMTICFAVFMATVVLTVVGVSSVVDSSIESPPVSNEVSPEFIYEDIDYTSHRALSAEEQSLVKNVAKAIIKDGMTELEKAKAIHDYMVMNIDYDTENYDANTIPADSYRVIGALKNKYAVCDGYARTFQALCEVAGLECEYVVGTVYGGELHAWNQVQINGKWYNVDVTWDDPRKNEGETFDDHRHNRYDYFLLADEIMYRDHETTDAKHVCSESIHYEVLRMGIPWGSYIFVENQKDLYEAVEKMVAINNPVICLMVPESFVSRMYIATAVKETLKEFPIVQDYQVLGANAYTPDAWGIYRVNVGVKLNNDQFTHFEIKRTVDEVKAEILRLVKEYGTEGRYHIYMPSDILNYSYFDDYITRWAFYEHNLVVRHIGGYPYNDKIIEVDVKIRERKADDYYTEHADSYADVEAIIQRMQAEGHTRCTINLYFGEIPMETNDAGNEVQYGVGKEWESKYGVSVHTNQQSTDTMLIYITTP